MDKALLIDTFYSLLGTGRYLNKVGMVQNGGGFDNFFFSNGGG